jgi:transposase-like protein
MEQAQNEGSELASGEGANAPAPSPPAGSTSVKQLEADEAQRVPPSRRKLSDEQEREVTRLCADTTMPVSEIARKFGIGESSVYRVAQRHGAALRGRQTPPGAPPAEPAAAGARGRPGGRAAAPAAKPSETRSTPAVAGAPARVRPRDANAREAAPTAALAHTERGPSGARARLRARGATLGRFRIRFLAERVVRARDIQDALRQAESFEAIEVTAVTREE